MRSIFKFPIETADAQEVAMPKGASILCVQVQRGVPCLWALVDTAQPIVPRKVFVVGTGHLIPADAELYVGTYQLNDGAFVGHVFEGKP